MPISLEITVAIMAKNEEKNLPTVLSELLHALGGNPENIYDVTLAGFNVFFPPLLTKKLSRRFSNLKEKHPIVR